VSQVPFIGRSNFAAGSSMTSIERAGGALLLVYAWWFLIFTDLHYMVANYVGGGPVFQRIPVILLIPMTLVLLQHGTRGTIYWPLVLFAAVHFAAIFGAGNRGYAFAGFKTMVFYVIAFTTAVAVIRTPSQALTLCRMFLFSFLWFFCQGLPQGSVSWHHVLGNTDAFGPLGVMGMGLGYFYGLGSKAKKWRYLGFGIAALGAVAMVASFARGAFLGAVIVSAFIWFRSPRKMMTLGAGVAGALLVLAAAELTHPGGEFWSEMATIAEGTSSGTGEGRWTLWSGVAWPVFLTSPIVGVGAYNTGVIGSRIIPPGTLIGMGAQPGRLYNFEMHNVYVQILAEEGIVGILLWVWMIVDFYRRLARMRTKSASAIWSRAVQSRVDLLYLTRGLEAAMAAFLLGAIFYNQAYQHWFYTLLLQAVILSRVTSHPPSPGDSAGPGILRSRQNRSDLDRVQEARDTDSATSPTGAA
jgi:O-antigen ligase